MSDGNGCAVCTVVGLDPGFREVGPSQVEIHVCMCVCMCAEGSIQLE